MPIPTLVDTHVVSLLSAFKGNLAIAFHNDVQWIAGWWDGQWNWQGHDDPTEGHWEHGNLTQALRQHSGWPPRGLLPHVRWWIETRTIPPTEE